MALAGALTLLASAPCISTAQGFPAKPITLIATAAPGGSSDILARGLAKIIQAQSGITVIVENKSGAGGSIGMLALTSAVPDGYTLAIANPDTVTVFPLVQKNPRYTFQRDLKAIVQVSEADYMFAVNAANPSKNLTEFAQYSKTHPNMNFGSTGTGASTHVIVEMYKQKTGADIKHIPYRSNTPALMALATNEVDLVSGSIASMKALLDQGRIKVIGLASDERVPEYPAVPTAGEVGIKDFSIPTWWGIFAPTALPADTAKQLNAIFTKAVTSDEFKQFTAPFSMRVKLRNESEFTEYIRNYEQSWRIAIKSSAISVDE